MSIGSYGWNETIGTSLITAKQPVDCLWEEKATFLGKDASFVTAIFSVVLIFLYF